MPELPEVETIRRGLVKIKGKQIAKVLVRHKKMVRPSNLPTKVKNRKITEVERRGKMLIIHLDNGSFLLIHLKMTGQLVLRPKAGKLVVGGHPIVNVVEVPNKFTHVEIHFKDKSVLYFNDVRKFGWLKLVELEELVEIKANYGPEPLDNDLSEELWLDILRHKQNLSIKKALLDQKVIAGIGNIYVDEASYYTKVKPTRKIKTLTIKERLELLKNLRKVLNLSIKHGGTSFSNYRNVQGVPGNFTKFLKVYGKKEVTCNGKKHPVTKIKHAGRGTHYCSSCQR